MKLEDLPPDQVADMKERRQKLINLAGDGYTAFVEDFRKVLRRGRRQGQDIVALTGELLEKPKYDRLTTSCCCAALLDVLDEEAQRP